MSVILDKESHIIPVEVEKHNGDCIELNLHPEYFRVVAYSSVVMSFVIGYLMTTLINIKRGWVDVEDNVLYENFGYNHLLFYVQELPGRYAALFAFTVFSFCCVVYETILFLLSQLSYRNGEFTKLEFRILACTTIFNCFAALYSLQLFVVHPSEDLLMHFIPFSAIILALSVNAVRELYVEIYRTWYMYLYTILLVAFSILKLTFQYMVIVLLNPPPVWLGQSSDIIWTFLAVAVPLLNSISNIIYSKDTDAPFVLRCNISTPGMDPDCTQDPNLRLNWEDVRKLFEASSRSF